VIKNLIALRYILPKKRQNDKTVLVYFIPSQFIPESPFSFPLSFGIIMPPSEVHPIHVIRNRKEGGFSFKIVEKLNNKHFNFSKLQLFNL
jgi:hypothetical protein